MGLCSHVIEFCLLSQPLLTHKIAWNLLLELWGNGSHTIWLHRQHNSPPPIEQKCAYVCVYVRVFMVLAPLRHSHNHQLPPIQANTHSFTQVSVCVHTQTPFSAPVKCFHWNSHIAPQGQVAAITFSYIWSRNLCRYLLNSCQSYRVVVNGRPGWHRGSGEERRGEERRGEEEEKDSSEVDDGPLGCSKAMSKNSSHQAAC